MDLKDDDLDFISNALRAAAEVYRRDAELMNKVHTGLYEQFRHQAARAETLAERIDGRP